MRLTKIFYILKPCLPRSLQIFLRKKYALYKLSKVRDVWPIDRTATTPPPNWKGWFKNKRFAFILTHDVDTQTGHDRALHLMQIEKNLGFKSSFNFVPERYKVSASIRKQISDSGYEIGVHGLNHDGKLYNSYAIFKKRASKINFYLKAWESVGFRSPAMHHNLNWLHELNIKYDASTFDTDPFEPQSDGVKTIFPFWVHHPQNGTKYLELPYTLPQDFTLFILLKHDNYNLWQNKLEWICKHGGMALLNTHPDYMCFQKSKPGREEYSVELYHDFLSHVKKNYAGQYWNVLPNELYEYLCNTNT